VANKYVLIYISLLISDDVPCICNDQEARQEKFEGPWGRGKAFNRYIQYRMCTWRRSLQGECAFWHHTAQQISVHSPVHGPVHGPQSRF